MPGMGIFNVERAVILPWSILAAAAEIAMAMKFLLQSFGKLGKLLKLTSGRLNLEGLRGKGKKDMKNYGKMKKKSDVEKDKEQEKVSDWREKGGWCLMCWEMRSNGTCCC